MRPSDPSIETLDPASASDADLAAVHALDVAVERDALPGEPTSPLEQALAEYRQEPVYRHRRWWVARGDGAVVGRAVCAYDDIPENRNHALVDVKVLPAWRRHGLGTVLLRRAVEAAQDWGCSILDFSARAGGPSGAFLHAVGAELRLVERRSVWRLDGADRALLESWVRRAPERAAGYSLVGWDGPCPDDLLAAFADLKAVMNTAPLGDLERDDDVFTPERWRAYEAGLIEQGFESWVLCAHHDGSGELAGFTELVFPLRWPEMAWQEDTGVWPKHRNRGLGRWLKAAMALRVLDERRAVRRIETWNAGSNEAMLGINVAMGFEPLENWGATGRRRPPPSGRRSAAGAETEGLPALLPLRRNVTGSGRTGFSTVPVQPRSP